MFRFVLVWLVVGWLVFVPGLVCGLSHQCLSDCSASLICSLVEGVVDNHHLTHPKIFKIPIHFLVKMYLLT